MSGRVVVTGASGFVGGHLVARLLERGAEVRCLVRESSRLDPRIADRVDRAVARLDDLGSLERAVADAETVLHLAGAVAAPDEATYHRVNAEGTRSLADACRRTGAGRRRFVLVSSLAAAGPSRPGRPRGEEEPPAPISAYGRSKLAGEEALRRFDPAHLPWTILRPPAVYGPGDRGFLKLAHMVARGWVLRLGREPQTLSLVHVHDLVDAILAAIEPEVAVAQTYFTAHPDPTDWDRIARAMARGLDRDIHIVGLPRPLLPWVGRASGWVARLRGRTNPLPADRLVDLLAAAWTCDSSKAAQDLGWTARIDHESGLADTARGYREEGWL